MLNCLGYTKVNNSTIHGTRISLIPLQSNISNASQTLTTASGRTLNLQNRRLIPFMNDLGIDNFSSSSSTQISHSLLKLSVKQISEKFSNDLAKISSDIVTHLDLSRRDYQLILRNSVGKQIEDIVGCNPFVSRHLMEQNLREKSKHLKSNFDLQFAEWNGTVVGYTNIQKSLEWIQGKKSLQDIVKTPNDAIVVYFYVDLFPWLSWSRFFTGETTIRMKILEPTNTLRSIATVAAWLGPDTNEYVSNLGKFVFSQMHCLSAISHPLKGNQIKVHVRGLADGAQRRSITGCSSASSSYPIPENFEHRTQMGDLSVFQDKPIITINDNVNANTKFTDKFGDKKTSNSERNEFAKNNFGLTGRINPTGLDTYQIYPPMMHRALNCLGSLCLRADVVSKSLFKNNSCWLEKIKPFARKIDEKSKHIKFDEIGLKAFFAKHEEIVTSSNFTGITLDILKTFFASLEDIMPKRINIPMTWTRPYFYIKIRGTLGCGTVFIFGKSLVTPAMRQLTVYTGHYLDQAKHDSELAGLPYGLGQFNDSIMEGAHKKAKQGKYLFSGGKSGKVGKKEYQERVIEQQLLSEWFRNESQETKLCYTKMPVNRELTFDQDVTSEKMVNNCRSSTFNI